MSHVENANAELFLVNPDLSTADHIIQELDRIIQQTENLELSRTLNEISDCYDSIRDVLQARKDSRRRQAQLIPALSPRSIGSY